MQYNLVELVKKSNCKRRQYSAILIQHNKVVGTGFNCANLPCEVCAKNARNAKHGEDYAGCNSIHAEENAVNMALRECVDLKGSTLYLYGEENGVPLKSAKPCKYCQAMLDAFGVMVVDFNAG